MRNASFNQMNRRESKRRNLIAAIFVIIGLFSLISIAQLHLQQMYEDTSEPAVSFIRSVRGARTLGISNERAKSINFGGFGPVKVIGNESAAPPLLQNTATAGTNKLGTLTCLGMPVKSEVIYWRDISSDREFVSPYRSHQENEK